VKCSYQRPCKTCVDREHPQLCDFHPAKRPNLGSEPCSTSPNPSTAFVKPFSVQQSHDGLWTPSRTEWDELHRKVDRIERLLLDLRNEGRTSASSKPRYNVSQAESDDGHSVSAEENPATGINTNSDLLGENVYLGGNSVPAMVVAMGKTGGGHIQELLGKSILPVFGLDNSTSTYPFVDLWGLPHGSIVRIEQLCALLPSPSDCLQFFAHYRDTAHVLYPGVSDLQQFEHDLTNFLISRGSDEICSDGNELATQKAYGKDLHWIGLLFATLASGCQCSGRPRKERQLTSQVYGAFVRQPICHNIRLTFSQVCCAYECLRIVNYLSHSTIVDIQNLLVLGNVISNNMNAGVAWALLGTFA
jgi:hypothetical protein